MILFSKGFFLWEGTVAHHLIVPQLAGCDNNVCSGVCACVWLRFCSRWKVSNRFPWIYLRLVIAAVRLTVTWTIIERWCQMCTSWSQCNRAGLQTDKQTNTHAHTHKWNANITATAWDAVVDQYNRFQSFLHLWDKLDVWNKLQQFGASRNSPGCVFLSNVRRQKSLFFFSSYWLYVQPFLLLSIFICLCTFSVSVLLTGPLNAFRRPHLS